YSSFFFSSRRRHTRCYRDWSSDVCSSDLQLLGTGARLGLALAGIDQRGIGEPVDGNVVAAAGLAPALAIGVVDRRRAAVSGQERSEERRVGKEWRWRGAPSTEKKKRVVYE